MLLILVQENKTTFERKNNHFNLGFKNNQKRWFRALD